MVARERGRTSACRPGRGPQPVFPRGKTRPHGYWLERSTRVGNTPGHDPSRLPRGHQGQPATTDSSTPGTGRSSGLRACGANRFLLPTASRPFWGQCHLSGGRSRLPLRGSPGFSPGSLFILNKCPENRYEAQHIVAISLLSNKMLRFCSEILICLSVLDPPNEVRGGAATGLPERCWKLWVNTKGV